MARPNHNNHGGKHPGAGRPKGSRSKVNSEVRRAAADFGLEALEVLREIANNKKNPPAPRVSAAIALLDRAYGKPNQPIALTGTLDVESLSDADLVRIIAAGTIHGSVGNGHAPGALTRDSGDRPSFAG